MIGTTQLVKFNEKAEGEVLSIYKVSLNNIPDTSGEADFLSGTPFNFYENFLARNKNDVAYSAGFIKLSDEAYFEVFEKYGEKIGVNTLIADLYTTLINERIEDEVIYQVFNNKQYVRNDAISKV